MDNEDDSKKDLVRGIAENQLTGIIPQRTLAKAVGNMSTERFADGIDGLVDENVLSKPSYDSRKGIVYTFYPDKARTKGYL
ncbi:MAG: hypothetical protein AABX23_03655 [Nanoarchaeota archaeon]